MRTSLFVGVGAAAVAIATAGYAIDALHGVELATVDARFAVRGAQAPPDDLVVVRIDDKTFSDLGVRWPFPRSLHAKAVDRIAADGASVIAYDIQFTEPSTPADDSLEAANAAAAEDNALIDAVARAGNVVLTTTEVDDSGGTSIFGGDDVLKEIGALAGNGLLPTDRGGVIRRVPFEVDGLGTFGLIAAGVASGTKVAEDALREDRAWIDYVGPPDTMRGVSFSDVVAGRVPKGFFRDKAVVVGPSAPSLQDVHPTSTSGDTWMAGAEVQANVISTALRGFPLRSAPVGLDIALILLLGMLVPAAGLRFRPLHALAGGALAGGAFVVGAQVAFQQGQVVTVAYPLGALAVSAVGALAIHYLVEAFERERLRDLFGRFVSEPVVDHVLARTGSELRLGGERMEGTVMFTDLRGFTTFSESLPPKQVIEALNRYLSEMSDAILEHGGTLVCYMGDGIFAVFGAPIAQSDHADRALACAREMLETRLPRFNAWMREQGFDHEFKMGIGLNSGPFMSGNVGSERRLEYAAIGDTTNTASRIEGMTKGTPHSLFVADSTRDALADRPDDLVYVDEMAVRGRTTAIKLWSLGDSAAAAA